MYLRILPKSIKVYNQFWLKNVNERKNVTVSNPSQPAFTCSKLAIETLERSVKKRLFAWIYFCGIDRNFLFFFAWIYFHRRDSKRIFPWIKLRSSDTSVTKLLLYDDGESLDFVTNTLILNAFLLISFYQIKDLMLHFYRIITYVRGIARNFLAVGSKSSKMSISTVDKEHFGLWNG